MDCGLYLQTEDCGLETYHTITPLLLNLITSIGQLHTHFEQFVHLSSMMLISASLSSIASSGQTPTQHPQKSHLLGSISISNIPVLA
jgi:hypothetical protein